MVARLRSRSRTIWTLFSSRSVRRDRSASEKSRSSTVCCVDLFCCLRSLCVRVSDPTSRRLTKYRFRCFLFILTTKQYYFKTIPDNGNLHVCQTHKQTSYKLTCFAVFCSFLQQFNTFFLQTMVICTCVRFTSRRLTNWRRWWRLPRGTTTMRVSCFAFMLILFHVCVF